MTLQRPTYAPKLRPAWTIAACVFGVLLGLAVGVWGFVLLGRYADPKSESVTTRGAGLSPSWEAWNDHALDPTARALQVINSSGAPLVLTGLEGGVDGRVIILQNLSFAGAQIFLAPDDPRSRAENRFKLDTGVSLESRSLLLLYDGAIHRWRVIPTEPVVLDGPPTLTDCGFGADVARGSDNFAGTVQTGHANSDGTVRFANAPCLLRWAGVRPPPVCVVVPTVSSVNGPVSAGYTIAYEADEYGLTVRGVPAGDVFQYECRAR